MENSGDGGLSSSADVLIHFLNLDVNDNAPILVADYTYTYFCTPRREEQKVIIQAYVRDSPKNSAPFRFSLPNDAALQKYWMVTIINGTHAYLSMRSHYLEPRVHQVPVIITNTGAKPQSKHVPITVTVCPCNNKGVCWVDVGKMPGMPTLSSALGITLGTLGAIGIFLIIIFARLATNRSSLKSGTMEGVPLKDVA